MSVVITGAGAVSAKKSLTKSGTPTLSYDTEYFFPKNGESRTAAPCFRIQHSFSFGSTPLSLLPAQISQRMQQGTLFNRTTELALYAICEAVMQAGYTLQELQKKRVGLALGTTVGCMFHNEPYYLDWKNGRPCDSTFMARYLNSNLAESLQKMLGWQGTSTVITNACASGTDAVGLAKLWLEHDLCDVAVAGGADELSRVACHGFHSLMLVSEKPCQPFTADRDGLNLGEGAGVLFLEKEEAAAGRILGRVRGFASAADGYHPTAPHPEGRGLQQALTLAMQEAGVCPADIAYINAHGTGTPANDRTEAYVLSALGFQEKTAVVSTKGETGHTLGAAGGLEAVFTLFSLRQGKTDGTTGCQSCDTALPIEVVTEQQQFLLAGGIGISQSLAFGGTNSVVVMEAC